MTLSWYAVMFAEGQNCKTLSFATCKQKASAAIHGNRVLKIIATLATFLFIYMLPSSHKTGAFSLCFYGKQNSPGRLALASQLMFMLKNFPQEHKTFESRHS